MFCVYILKSLKYDKYYEGQTKDLEKRLIFHNSNQARWTRRFQPWEIVYVEAYSDRSGSMRREKELKKVKNIRVFLNNKSK